MTKFNRDEMNTVFHLTHDILNYDYYDEDKYYKLTPELVKEADYYDGPEYDFLGDYEVKIETEGDHRNDGQLVDYYFSFKSPEGQMTKIHTEMCLMVGWNHCEDEIIN